MQSSMHSTKFDGQICTDGVTIPKDELRQCHTGKGIGQYIEIELDSPATVNKVSRIFLVMCECSTMHHVD